MVDGRGGEKGRKRDRYLLSFPYFYLVYWIRAGVNGRTWDGMVYIVRASKGNRGKKRKEKKERKTAGCNLVDAGNRGIAP